MQNNFCKEERPARLIKDRLEVALGGLVAPLLGLELLLDALAGLTIITWSCDQSDQFYLIKAFIRSVQIISN